MSATQYVYRTVDLRSNTLLEDVELTGVKFTIVLNGQGELDANLYVPDSIKGRLLDTATLAGRTGLYVFRNGIPVWGGIIWKRDWDESTNSWRLTCRSWESYAYHIEQDMNKAYTSTDQMQIGLDLLTQVTPSIQSQSGIEPPDLVTSGVNRQRYMWSYEHNSIGHELELLSGLENSFDYIVENYIKSDGSLGRKYVFGYPRIGRSADPNDSSSLFLEYPGNLQPFTLLEDAENSAWTVHSIGAGEGATMLQTTSLDGSYDLGGWPLLEITTQYKDVSILSTLQSHSDRDLADSLPPTRSWGFKLSPHSDVSLTDITIGDSAVFRLSSRRWPAPWVFVGRITLITVTPGDNGALEEIEIGLADPVVGQDNTTDSESDPPTSS